VVSSIEGFGMRARAAGLDRSEVSARTRQRWPDFGREFQEAEPRQRRLAVFPMTFVAVQGSAMREDLCRIVDEWRPAALVHEPNVVAAAPVAAARGIPHVVVGFGGFLPVDVMAAAEDSLRELWRAEGLEVPPWGGLYDDLYLHPFPPSFGPPPFSRTIQPMRAMGFDGVDGGAPPPWLEALGVSRPCVYVTFGTEIGNMAPFGVVAQAFDGIDMDAVITVGRDADPDAVTPRPTNVRVERYLPQRMVLARSSLLVSHAGSGAVLGAAASGVPQLCVPIAADQFDNADVVTASGCGLSLEPHDVTTDSVHHALHRLLGGDSFQDRARFVADEIAAMAEPAERVPMIEMLANATHE
jgi:hypothetical protein